MSHAAVAPAVLYTLYGKVVDAKGAPLSNVAVAIEGEPRGTYTNRDGVYSFAVPVGTHTIQAYFVGYERGAKSLEVMRDTRCDFCLVEQVVTLDAVAVEGKSMIQRLKESVYSVNAIDIASNVSTIHNLADIVNESVGVHIRQSGGLGSAYDLTVNGLGGDAIKYFIDGVPMSAKGGSYSLENIPVSIIDRIEIHKGVVPAQFGGDALGGAINIVTKERDMDYLDLSYGVGSFDTHKVDFNGKYTTRKHRITLRPYLGYNYSRNNYIMKDMRVLNTEENKFEYRDCERFHDRYRSMVGEVEVGISDYNWADYFTLSASLSATDKQLQTGATHEVVYGKVERQSNAYSFGLRYMKDSLFVDGLSLKLEASHSVSNSSIIDTALVRYYWNGHTKPHYEAEISRYPVTRYFDRPTTILRTNLNHLFNEQHGVNFNYLMNVAQNRFSEDCEPEYQSPPSDDCLSRHYLGLTYNLSLHDDRWHTSLFVKEYINGVALGDKEMSPSDSVITGYKFVDRDAVTLFTGYGAGSRYRFYDELSAKASYEYSVRLPSAFQILGDGENVLPNYQLEPEKSHNVNLGLFGMIKHTDHRLSYELGGFYRNIHDFIMMRPGMELYRFENLSRISITGADAELIYYWADRLRLRANASYECAVDLIEEKLSDGKPNAAYRQRIPNRPTLYGNLNAQYALTDLLMRDDKLLIGYNYQYVHWYYLTWSVFGAHESKSIIPTQQLHSVDLTYSMMNERYNVSLSIDNIFDALAYDNYKLQKPGRSFFLKLRMFLSTPNDKT